MEKNTYSLEEVFEGRFFKIPDYQRGYAWEERHCRDLLEDLEQLPPNLNHYTGTLVFHANNEEIIDSEGSKHLGFNVVDGQQRIISIIILLNTIKYFFEKEEKYKLLSVEITKNYLFANRHIDNNFFYKLTLNQDCKEFFKEDILGTGSVTGPTIKSHDKLFNAKTVFNNYVIKSKKLYKDKFFDWLLELYNKLIERLRFGIYFVDKSAEVGVIFEVMNNRGKNLTELEKVKNYLLYVTTKINVDTKDELEGLINKTWSTIYQRFMSADLDTNFENNFLMSHWLMYSDYDRKKWEGSKSIKNKYNLKLYKNRDIKLLNDISKYVSSLNKSSEAFVDLFKPDRGGAFNSFTNDQTKSLIIIYSIKLLRSNTIATFIPLLMACRLIFTNIPEYYLELIKILEIYAFRIYNVGRKRSDTGQPSIFKSAYKLFKCDIKDGDIKINEVYYLLRKLIKKYCSNDVFYDFWVLNISNNNWYYWSALKYFLYEYEESFSKDKPYFAWSYFAETPLKNSIEHILPQNINDVGNYWKDKFTQDEHDIYIHDIGNLCLTFNNSSYRNNGFNIKKGSANQEEPCYANSYLKQERELTEYEEWNVQNILKRRKKLTEWAKKRWFIDLSDIKEDDSVEPYEDDGFEPYEDDGFEPYEDSDILNA